ncbi:acyl carrier protein [Paenibacillus melissococcoides]|uniref:Acyl carrier protein n=1 Tax=Paenibacillus melissococcoides TaxID=2912268 RepID=A0ABM9GA96_9BACL|nr:MULTISPECIES: acyl carrier protein [Paenibacillus]MEB9894625.1 acyl carrier protein [Bacillus cereus]CAH8248887.1 acyl carrier protein [Paenibacillus melissococcoides]CAH8720698.1 acyl carrier protein [Paenibacillus melissococcoides]CAH8720941.1 acyl carrier protein [Paenibacillus melissococcoides]GIO79219.1 acyl carrier protein [Paenibacillus dendritiformis]
MELELQKIFAKALDIPVEKVVDELEYNSIPEWDSIAHMSLVAEMEQHYDIMLDTEDVIDMSSYAEAKRILNKYGVVLK